MIENGYKNDGFDLSDVAEPDVKDYYVVVDLETFEIVGMFSNSDLIELELAKLSNSKNRMTTVLTYPKALIDTPVEVRL